MREVANLEEFLGALGQGEMECATPHGAVSYLGALYVHEMLEIAREEYPNQEIILWADCGTDEGAALAAIRHRLPHITFAGEDEAYVRLKDMAEQVGLQLRHCEKRSDEAISC